MWVFTFWWQNLACDCICPLSRALKKREMICNKIFWDLSFQSSTFPPNRVFYAQTCEMQCTLNLIKIYQIMEKKLKWSVLRPINISHMCIKYFWGVYYVQTTPKKKFKVITRVPRRLIAIGIKKTPFFGMDLQSNIKCSVKLQVYDQTYKFFFFF